MDFRLGDWIVRPSLDQIERNGEVAPLQHLSMRVLCYLAERSGTLVTYDELLVALWPGRVASEDAVHRRVADLRQQLGDEARSPRYIETILKQGYRVVAHVEPLALSDGRPWRVYAASVLAVLVIAVLGVVQLTQNHLPPDVIAAAQAALADDDYESSHRLIEPYLDAFADQPEIEALRAELILDISLETDPPAAKVEVKPYTEPSDPWRMLGATPLESQHWLIRLSAAGRETLELALPNPSRAFNNGERPRWVFELPEAGTVPEGMVFVQPFEGLIPIMGLRRMENLGPFFIGRSEVSNAEYQAFVAAGGYSDARFWSALAEAEPPLTMDDVGRLFVDQSGQPGPATWLVGKHPSGSADHPVSGVSYYEAMAYAAFRGMKLPTARHWARAALGIDEQRWPLASALLPVARLSGTTTVAGGTGAAISTWGSLHMVGNAREWTRDYSGKDRMCVGSSYLGPVWNYALPGFADPMLRSPTFGFRLASYSDDTSPVAIVSDGAEPRLPMVSDETFAGIIRQLHYPDGTVRATDAEPIYERDEYEWSRRKVLLPTEDPDDPLPVLLFVPKQASGALHPVIFIPPGDSYEAGYPSERIDITNYDIDFLVREGMSVIWPIYWGTHERYVRRAADGSGEQLRAWQLAIDRRRNELGRVIDYVSDHPDFDGDQVSLMAVSYGATFMAPPLLAAEKRVKSAVLLATGLARLDPDRVPLHLNPNTYWPRITQPLLVLSGRYDLGFNAGTSEPSILKALRPPAERNRVILYPSAHWPLPPRRIRSDVLAWYDEQPFDGPYTVTTQQ
jgi:DNA-binding winged helix-turn-helix (wHTH) protein/dienelactone hydrolase